MKLFRITGSLLVLLLSLVALAFVAVHPARAQELNPPPPSFETCKTVGNGTICQGNRIATNAPSDTGIVCGSGPSAFDVFDSSTFKQVAIRYYDQDGNLTRRVSHEDSTFAQFSNPLTGAVAPYTQHTTFTTVLAVPGDFSTAPGQFENRCTPKAITDGGDALGVSEFLAQQHIQTGADSRSQQGAVILVFARFGCRSRQRR